MKVFLRAFNISDFESIYTWLLDRDNQLLTCGDIYFASKDYVRKWVEGKIFDSKDQYFAICLKGTNEIIGYTSIKEIDYRNRKAAWGGILIGDKKFWGKGIATEVGQLVIRFAFDEMNLNLIWSWVLEEHSASIRMAEKVGFRRSGVLPQGVFKNGKFNNMVLVYVLKEDYDQVKQ